MAREIEEKPGDSGLIKSTRSISRRKERLSVSILQKEQNVACNLEESF